MYSLSKLIIHLTDILSMKKKEKKAKESSTSDLTLDSKGNVKENPAKKDKKHLSEKEFTIDEEFFHGIIMPNVYSTIISGLKQDHIALFNLMFAFEIAKKKDEVKQEEVNFFLRRFLAFKNYKDWRKTET